MTEVHWLIPPSVLRHLERVPADRPVVVLLRHSVRGDLPPDAPGDMVPITEIGRRLALELGARLGPRLSTLHTSPVLRCVQTAEALREGAEAKLGIVPDRLLGDPGVFVIDGRHAWAHWQSIGHERVMHYLVNEPEPLPGMARAEEAARFLVRHMLGVSAGRTGVHVFVTHDSVVTAAAARILGKSLGREDWPWYLEGAFFWEVEDGVNAVYRHDEAVHPGPLCSLADSDVIEFAKREVAATIGLDTGARFFLAGGAFKSLLTGRPPRDLDFWAPSERDRCLLIDALHARGARPTSPRPFSDGFELAGRLIEIPKKVEPPTLRERLARFDIGLSAVGVEHDPAGEWSAMVDPLAIESVRFREVRLLKPLVNWRYALTTLERMRRYARELSFSVPAEEEDEVWRVFEGESEEMRAGMIDRYRRTGIGGFGVMEEVECRFR